MSASADLGQDADGARERHRAAPAERGGEGLALEELHREVHPAVGQAAKIVDLDDVLVVDLGDRGGLAAKSLDGKIVTRQIVVQDLHGDALVHGRVLADVDRARRSGAEAGAKQPALGEDLPDERIGGLADLA